MGLSIRIGDIPIRILPSFFLVALLLGASVSQPLLMALWVAVVFVSVVVHELGHATIGRAFGLQASIVLHGFGGTTSWAGSRRLSPAQSIAVSLAGPGAGFALGALVLGVSGRNLVDLLLMRGGWSSDPRAFAVEAIIFVNFGWGILNLLPMLPLDGGNALAQALNAATRGHGERPARIVSLCLASLAAVYALVTRSLWPAFLAVSFAMTNWRALQALSAAERESKSAKGPT
jgi:Zn-dependent protease